MTRTTNRALAADKSDSPARKSGRAVIEQDGRSIWEWQTATGVFERDVTLEQLARLEDAGLALVQDKEPEAHMIYGHAEVVTARPIESLRSSPRSGAQSRAAEGAPRSMMVRLLKRIGVKN